MELFTKWQSSNKVQTNAKPLHQFSTGPQCDAVEDGGDDDHEEGENNYYEDGEGC